MRPFSKILSGLALTLVLLSGCGVDLSVPKIEIPAGTIKVNIDPADLQREIDRLQGNQLVCSAGLPASAGGVVSSGVASPIEVTARGGVGPYTILSTAISFSSQTVLSRTYTNTGSTNRVVVDTVSVVDSLGIITQCNFSVTVLPTTSPSTLACTMVPTPSSAMVNNNVSFLTTASGGTSSYTFSNLTLGTDGSVVTGLAPINSTQATAVGRFSSSGLKTNSVRVTDSSGTFVVCSSTVSISGSASVSLVASPSTTAQVGSSIVVSAIASNFSPAPTSYVFSTTESGVLLSPSGNSVTVTSSNGMPHSAFNVQVVASNGSQSASSSIALTFVGTTGYLSCVLNHPVATYYTGNQVPFTATASSGEALTITTFVASSDATVTTTGNATRNVAYANPGSKIVYALAKSTSTGQFCNDGNYLVDSLTINNSGGGYLPLACSAYTNYNPTVLNQSFYAYGVLTGGNPSNRWVDTLRVLRNGVVVSNYSGYWYDRYTAVLSIFTTRGTYQVELTAKDSLGNTAVCSTNHIVQ
jgi:hypothetical protein